MAFNFYEALTALSTAATGLLVFMQFRTQRALASPFLSGSITNESNGELLVRLLIYPADLPVQFTKISAVNADVGVVKINYDPGGTVVFSLIGDWQPALVEAIDIGPARVSSSPVTQWFFIKLRSNQSSVLISLHTRVMWLPVRYKIKVAITINT
ncbi:hypothetical protein [Janthinobacterium sp. TND4EL3]|uniref:hypothetical protein n=1 Tax=Janthinobacterium sp. TND4EL3 TaxID=1907311 RepID=UPI0009707169|nr:hypothetical protein [Janthinobacterium sp. TND4EL3]